MLTETQKSLLIQMASEMVLGKDMPAEFAGDWGLPKTTPKRAQLQIEASARIARLKCREWSKRIMAIVEGKVE